MEPMKKINFSIIIVNYNTRDLLNACLNSVYKSSGDITYEVIVADNNSSDGTIEMLSNEFKEIQLIINRKNLGFAKACNQGIRASKGQYIILLNSDTEIFPDTLFNLKSYLFNEKNDPKTGIIGCKIMNPDGSLQYSTGNFPTLCSTIFDMFKPYHKRKYCLTDYNTLHEVDWVTGAFMVIDRNVINDVGFFDESYFMYYEEVDLCLQAKKRGWKVFYYPFTSIVHKTPMSAKKDSTSLKVASEVRCSHLYYYRKNHNYLSFLALAAATIIVLFLMLLKWHTPFLVDKEFKTNQRNKIKSTLLIVWQTFLDLNKQKTNKCSIK